MVLAWHIVYDGDSIYQKRLGSGRRKKDMNSQIMVPISMIEPSSWLRSGITVESVDNVNLVKFTSELHARLEELLAKKKVNLLSPEEEAEYAGISELERILTFINAKLIASRAHY
jgi:hypothetical protein